MEHIHEFTFLSISDRKTGLPLLPEISFAGKAKQTCSILSNQIIRFFPVNNLCYRYIKLFL